MAIIDSRKELEEFANRYWMGKTKPYAFGIGLKYTSLQDEILAVRYVKISVGCEYDALAALQCVVPLTKKGGACTLSVKQSFCILERFLMPRYFEKGCTNATAMRAVISNTHRKNVGTSLEGVVFVCQDRDELAGVPTSIEEAHFRLALISQGHEVVELEDVKNIMKVFPSLVYTDKGCYTEDAWEDRYSLRGGFDGEQVIVQGCHPPPYWSAPVKNGAQVVGTNELYFGDNAHDQDEIWVANLGSG